MAKKKSFTWEDLEKPVEEFKNNPIEKDNEKLEYLRKKILGHLDELQKKEEKDNRFPKNLKPLKRKNKIYGE